MEETTHLKSEIDRLNKIINILIDQISILKAENTNLKTRMWVNNPTNTITDIDNGIKESINAIVKDDNAANKVFNTIVENDNGTKEPINTIIKADNGTKEANTPIAENDNGIKESINPIAKVDNGTKEKISPIVKNDNAVKPHIETRKRIAPPHIDIKDDVADLLTVYLEKSFHIRVKHQKLDRVARELLLIHNSGVASTDELRKISGLSKPGYAKHAPTLRRAGLIQRLGNNKYTLTEKSKDLINEAFGV